MPLMGDLPGVIGHPRGHATHEVTYQPQVFTNYLPLKTSQGTGST